MKALLKRKPRLAVFDVEGVLIPKNRYLFFDVGSRLGFPQFVRIALYGILYELRLISLKSAMKHVFKLLDGFRIEELLEIFRRIPLVPGARELFEKLRSQGLRTALISSGLPSLVVRDLASTLNADYAFGLELETENSVATGEIWGEVIERNGKLVVLEKILKTERLSFEECVVVADDRNNAPILLPEVLKIGYNPDFNVRRKADYIVIGHPLEIIPLLESQTAKKPTMPSKNEIVREIIHACGLSIPFLSRLTGLYITSLFILAVASLFVVSELAMMERKNVPIVSSITRHAATTEELYAFRTAPVFYAFGILLTLLLFPFPANCAAIAAFTLGDSSASIFGKTFGKRPLSFHKGKTLEGSLIGFLFAFFAATLFVGSLSALLAATVAMLIEGMPLPLNDNIMVPIITGAALTLFA